MTSSLSSEPVLSLMGASAFLLDVAGPNFSEPMQRKIHSAARALRDTEGFGEIVPGMNNLLVTFDSRRLTHAKARDTLLELWEEAASDQGLGRSVAVPVTYGGASAEDIRPWAEHCGLEVEAAVLRHASGRYLVGAVGALPGFPYLSGLDPSLAMPRRVNPRTRVAAGSIMIGGQQAGILPIASPSGWNVIGKTEIRLFNAQATPPTLLLPGDEICFEVLEIRHD